MKKKLLIIFIILVCIGLGFGFWYFKYHKYIVKQTITPIEDRTEIDKALLENAISVSNNYPLAYVLPIITNDWQIVYDSPLTVKVIYKEKLPSEEEILTLLKNLAVDKKLEYKDHKVVFEKATP